MAQEVFRRIAEDLKGIDKRFEEAEDLIKALEEAGEDVTQLREEFRTLKAQAERWKAVLKARGIR
jgi:predicted nuclease with TOPRIM domain